jgi:4-diphosphocytidyl-2-C-methyl-D-erythritol kinase
MGSDVPFFLSGGTALGSGRGDQLTPLPDIQQQRLIIAWPDKASENKTGQMYSALQEADFSDGATTERLAKSTNRPTGISDEAITNVFEAVLRRASPEAGQAFADAHDAGQAHLAGSGPAFFFLLGPTAPAEPVMKILASMGVSAIETHTISGAEALGQP